MSVQFPETFDINKILITVDDFDPDVWLWTIPFSNGTCSIGVVGTEEYFKRAPEKTNEEILLAAIERSPELQKIMQGSKLITECRTLIGYAADVSTLYGDRFALLGNAGEFLDPIFSSGVTIALHSASLAARAVGRELRGETVDWEKSFSEPLKVGVRTFKTFVGTWYSGELQTIIFYPKPDPRIKRMICSILAGYAWDQKNPFVADAARTVPALAAMCAVEAPAPSAMM
jgi:flavin-dependent dehydrogenase